MAKTANERDPVNAPDISRLTKIGTPWPEENTAPVHFILYAEEDFEFDQLERWIATSRPEASAAAISRMRVQSDAEDAATLTPVEKFIEAPRNHLIVPLGIVWTTKDGEDGTALKFRDFLFSDKLAPSKRRNKEKVLATDPARCVLIAGEAATKQFLVERFEQKFVSDRNDNAFVEFVARQAVLTVEREQRRVPGAGVKLPRFVVPAIMARRDFQTQLKELAQETGKSLDAVEAHARDCLKEIAPSPNRFYVTLMAKIMRGLCGFGYENKIVTDETRLREIRSMVRNNPTALMFTHKSHVDGAALIAQTSQSNFPLVHMIGGINMAFAGMGTIAKKSGAIFIRRSFQDDPIYKACLRQYISYLLEKRFPVAWALEGTRSRIGKLMPPRYGILKYVTEAAEKNGIDNLHLVPVSIYYDLIPDIGSYKDEQRGATKRKESLAWFIGYVAGMRKPLGRIFMAFGRPVIAQLPPANDQSDTTGDGAAGDAATIRLQKLAFEAAVNSNEVTPLSASGVLALTMISAAPQALTEEEIIQDLEALRGWARQRNIPMTDDFDDAGTHKLRDVASAMIKVGVLERHETGLEPLFGIARDQQFTVSYYRNTVVHHFVTAAIAELALAKAAEAAPGQVASQFWDETLALRDLFKFEFFYAPSEQFRDEVSNELAHHDANWEAQLTGGGVNAEKLLETISPLFAHGALKPYIEGYSVMAEALMRLRPGDDSDEKTLVAACLKLGKAAVLRRQITGEEAIAKQIFSHAYLLAEHRGLVGEDARDMTGRRVAFAREMNELQRRLRLIEAINARRRAIGGLGVQGVVEEDGSVQVLGRG
ncbi:MAG: 1-acyl-sn-glycerol-3-phosphate acyltransferase [Aquisalinus sp.]|nr:1-acyl-sn-glycerol-3-phosphate acyltransferase [Aquisalinus sp.]